MLARRNGERLSAALDMMTTKVETHSGPVGGWIGCEGKKMSKLGAGERKRLSGSAGCRMKCVEDKMKCKIWRTSGDDGKMRKRRSDFNSSDNRRKRCIGCSKHVKRNKE